MEVLVAIAVGVLTAAGIYLVLRQRTFPVIVGLSLLTYAVNVFIFASGRLVVNRPPILSDDARGLHRPAAAGAGADRHRHLLRDDGGDRHHGAGRLPVAPATTASTAIEPPAGDERR